MNLILFVLLATIIVFICLAVLTILLYNTDTSLGVLASGISMILTFISALVTPTVVFNQFNANKTYTDEVIATYELLDDNYVTMSGGKTNYPYVCYRVEDDSIKTLRLDEDAKIITGTDEAKVEVVIVKWGFITNKNYIVYLPD